MLVCFPESELGDKSTSHPSPNRGSPTLHRLCLSGIAVSSPDFLFRIPPCIHILSEPSEAEKNVETDVVYYPGSLIHMNIDKSVYPSEQDSLPMV